MLNGLGDPFLVSLLSLKWHYVTASVDGYFNRWVHQRGR